MAQTDIMIGVLHKRLSNKHYLPLVPSPKILSNWWVFICQESYEEFKELPNLLCSLKLVFCSEGGIC